MLIIRIIAIAVCFHMAFSVTRVTASLDALAHGAGSLTVGILISLLAFFPTFLSMACGRWIDRVGAKPPVVIGGLFMLAGLAAPALFPAARFGLAPLAVSCSLVGIGIMAVTMLIQQLLGFISTPKNRLANFAWLATAMAASGFACPIISGYVIDHASHQWAFAFGTGAAAAGVLLSSLSLPLLPSGWGGEGKKRGSAGAFELLRYPRIRNVLFVSALVSMAWDLQIFMFPVYGHAVGLTATEIGWLIGTFFAATFVVRFLTPFLAKRFTEWQFLIAVLALGALAYFLFPFFTALPPLLFCAFILGLGLGASQPNVMSLLQSQSPKGRVGEALGIRTMFTNLCHTVLPAWFGVLAAAAGVFWIFMAMAGIMAASAVAARFRNREDEVAEDGAG